MKKKQGGDATCHNRNVTVQTSLEDAQPTIGVPSTTERGLGNPAPKVQPSGAGLASEQESLPVSDELVRCRKACQEQADIIANLHKAKSDDTKRLDWLEAGNGLDLFLNSYKWRKITLRESIDAAMRKDK